VGFAKPSITNWGLCKTLYRPDFDNGGRFLTDALFNHGISGGLIIATQKFQQF
jgi:hypothetical protein